MKNLTEADAARAFARAWNRLDPADFIAKLMPEARYASQWVFEELVGQPAIADYLIAKMRTVKNQAINDPTAKVFAELGKATQGFPGRDCVSMAQGQKESITAVALFEIEEGMIKRYDLCIPELLGVIRSGIYPI